MSKTIRLLGNLGGDINVTDEYLNSRGYAEIAAELPPVRLALNCVGGEAATDLCRVLAPGGTLVTYGGMSHRPVVVPLDLLTHKQLKLRGFWVAQWVREHSKEERRAMVEELLGQVRSKQLSFFYELVDLDDFSTALKRAEEPYAFRKVLLNLDYPDRLAEHDKKTEDDYWHFEAPAV